MQLSNHLTFFTPSTTILLLTALLLPFASPHNLPLLTPPSQPNTITNLTTPHPPCTNLTTAPYPPCYTLLNTTSYLTSYNLTRRETCAPFESWSYCLMRSVYASVGTNCIQQAPGVEKCDPFDCSSLNSTTCIYPRTSNRTGLTRLQAASWYGVWNVYAVHNHFANWAAALNRTSSEHAILLAVNPHKSNTVDSVLTSVITHYGINTNADRGILTLLKPEQGKAYGNARGRGEVSTLSGRQWRELLTGRLGEVLERVNYGFDEWKGVVGREGAFSTRGLSGSEALAERLGRK